MKSSKSFAPLIAGMDSRCACHYSSHNRDKDLFVAGDDVEIDARPLSVPLLFSMFGKSRSRPKRRPLRASHREQTRNSRPASCLCDLFANLNRGNEFCVNTLSMSRSVPQIVTCRRSLGLQIVATPELGQVQAAGRTNRVV
jgi:hypothetical protein